MTSEAIASVAHDVVSICRSTVQKAIDTQSKGAKKLIDNQAAFQDKIKGKLKLKSGTPLDQLVDNLEEMGDKARDQTKNLFDNYGRVAGEMIDWMAERGDSGIDRVDEMFLTRGGPVLDRVLLPGFELIRRVAKQTEHLTESVTDYVIDQAEQVIVAETHEAKKKPAARKTAKTAH